LLVRLLFVILIVAGIILALRWFARTPPQKLARSLRRAAYGTGIALLIFLAASGRLNWLYALIASLVPVVYRLSGLLGLMPLLQRLKSHTTGSSTPGSGRTSTIRTRYLRMSLDHDSGTMTGEVLDGRFQGRRLEQLTLQELRSLLEECEQNDAQSAAVLQAYLERTHSQEYTSRADAGTARERADGSSMTRTEAYEILGLSPGAATQEIIEAHRRLMQKLHPDRGGSTYLAAKLNQAKDLLLG
jgi:DnaJ domain